MVYCGELWSFLSLITVITTHVDYQASDVLEFLLEILGLDRLPHAGSSDQALGNVHPYRAVKFERRSHRSDQTLTEKTYLHGCPWYSSQA